MEKSVRDSIVALALIDAKRVARQTARLYTRHEMKMKESRKRIRELRRFKAILENR